MAAVTSSPSEVPHFQIVSKIDSIPVVHDSVAYAQSLINSNKLSAKLYETAVGVASKSYDVATPVLTRTKPLLESADGLAVATFDRAAATFPYPFKTPTEELIVVKQAKGVYDTKLHPVISGVIAKAASVNSAIGTRASATIHTSQDLAHALLEQLRQITEHGVQLPSVLFEGASKASNDVKEIVFAKDVSVQEKSNKFASYVLEQAKPLIDEIYNYVYTAKSKAVEKENKMVEEGSDASGNAADKANGSTEHLEDDE
ncbi:hypothetical protein I312_102892 [Cryptococcus bacillisporus CA1280]|uniref:Uncharacterized protein n=2 Tax=Cryptococcus gattii TaxID=552467 RepID=A0A0D0VVS9_CRYGA|nr:hypothetical protein I312_00505 [Cryptococcus bacillisporus CA1280]KIR58640.1 hypothetical protein I314_05479 [Cryptococcus bacillisporus CA1873]|eukprot:KIR58640.1 hypothetical protein I314_05479 [Cryptococcus gattii CA1873]